MAMHPMSDDDDAVVVFHGTTAASAERIMQDGFRPLDRQAVLTEVSQTYGVALGKLVEALESMGRMVVGLRNRVHFMSAATTIESAWSWASRAPEARWEALWGVWWAVHGTDEFGPWENPTVAAWHLRERLHDTPVALEVHVPATELRSPGGDPYGVEEASRRVAGRAIEVQFAPDRAGSWVRRVHPLPRLLDAYELCGLLGCDFRTLRARVKAGELPEAHEMPNGSWMYRADDYAALIDLSPALGAPPPRE